MTVFSWCSLLALERHTQDKLFLIYAVFEKIRVELPDTNTIHEFMRLLAWSLWFLWLGVWPDKDVRGRQSLGPHFSVPCKVFVRAFVLCVFTEKSIHFTPQKNNIKIINQINEINPVPQ